MTSKRVTIKIDIDSEDEEFWRPKVTKKKSHFDLVKNIEIDQEIYDPVDNYPLVRESVGSTELVDFEYLRLKDAETDSETSSSASSDPSSFPWKLFRAEPSKLHEIKSSWFFNACSEDQYLSRPCVKRLKLFLKKLFLFNSLLKKSYTRVQGNCRDTHNEILPVEEFENLQDKYLQEGTVTNDELNFDKLMIMYKNTAYQRRKRQYVSFTRSRSALSPRTAFK